VIEVERGKRTLRSWRLTPHEIGEVVAEAERLHAGAANTDDPATSKLPTGPKST